MKLPTKRKILQTARKYRDDPDVQVMAELADARRREIRKAQAEKNKSDKKKTTGRRKRGRKNYNSKRRTIYRLATTVSWSG